jgi:hypothetical protein
MYVIGGGRKKEREREVDRERESVCVCRRDETTSMAPSTAQAGQHIKYE